MNEPQRSRVMREVPIEWDEIMRLVTQIKFGEIIIKIQDGRIVLTEYTIKRRREESDDFTVIPL